MREDREFFRSSVSDEMNTPRPMTQQEEQEQARQDHVRRHRKRTARRAFSMAAPAVVVAAAVMVTAPPVPEAVPEPVATPAPAPTSTPVNANVCPVCGQTDCRYYNSTMRQPGQFIHSGDIPEARVGASVSENRMTYDGFSLSGVEGNLNWVDNLSYVYLQDGSLFSTSMDEDWEFLRENDLELSGQYSYSTDAFTEPQFSGVILHRATGDMENVAYVELLYVPDGSEPEPDYLSDVHAQYNMVDLTTFEKAEVWEYPEHENLWIRAYSDLEELTPEELREHLDIFFHETPEPLVDVGGTMQVAMDPAVLRLHGVSQSVAMYGGGVYLNDEGEELRYTIGAYQSRFNYSFSWYNEQQMRIGGPNLVFGRYNWNDLFARFNELYEQAPATGHQRFVYYIRLQDMTVNDITYSVYIEATKDYGQNMLPVNALWCVPQQEPTCTINVRAYFEAEPGEDIFSWEGRPVEELLIRGDPAEELSFFSLRS